MAAAQSRSEKGKPHHLNAVDIELGHRADKQLHSKEGNFRERKPTTPDRKLT